MSKFRFAIYYPYYKEKLEMIEFTNKLLLLWLSLKLILLLLALFDYILKLLTYHLKYKKKFEITKSKYKANLFYKSDYSTTFFL